MKLVRIVAVALFLVALGSPAFARCGYCDPWDRCVSGPPPMGCTQKPEGCLEDEIFCAGAMEEELTLVSVEVERVEPVTVASTDPVPAPEAKVVSAEE